MPDEMQDLKKLSPNERIAKLKELEAKKKKEIEEAEKLIRESIDEIHKEDNKKKELAEKLRAEEDLKPLEYAEAPKKEKNLEEELEQVKAVKTVEYKIFDDYAKLKNLYDDMKKSGVNEEKKGEFYQIRDRIYEEAKSADYLSNDALEALDASRKFLKGIGYKVLK